MKKNILILFICLTSVIYSQKSYDIDALGVIIGYEKNNNSNMTFGLSKMFYIVDTIALGGCIEARYITNFKNKNIFCIGGDVMFLGASAGLNISTKYFEPNIGIDAIYGKLKLGYAVHHSEKNCLTFGVQTTIPIFNF